MAGGRRSAFVYWLGHFLLVWHRCSTPVDSEWTPQFPLNLLLTVCIPPGASEKGPLLLLTLFLGASVTFGFLVLHGTSDFWFSCSTWDRTPLSLNFALQPVYCWYSTDEDFGHRIHFLTFCPQAPPLCLTITALIASCGFHIVHPDPIHLPIPSYARSALAAFSLTKTK